MLQQDTTIQEKTFSTDWWKNTFIKTTEAFTKTSVFKDCLAKSETAIMRENILDIVRLLCKLRTNQFGFRIYEDGRQLGTKEMNRVYDSPPKKGESLQEWTDRTFGDKKFGMIINRGEKLHNELAQRMAYKITPLLDQVGTPMLGINFTIFIGNYGWTPLGIHTDAPGESVTHFHLGPGGKTMYTWNREQYEELAGENKYNNKDTKKFLPHANVHPFEEGDLYYMPPNEFHIGRADELSIGLTLWLNNHLKTDLAKKLLRVITDQYLTASNETMLMDKNPLEDLSAAEQAIEMFTIPKDMENLGFRDLMRETFKDYRYSLYSNSGYWTRPFPKEVEEEYTVEDSFQIVKPFVMKYTESLDKENLLIYSRGTKVVLHNFECIKQLVDKINEGNVISVKEALSILDSDWEESVGLYIITLLDTYNGIEKIKN